MLVFVLASTEIERRFGVNLDFYITFIYTYYYQINIL